MVADDFERRFGRRSGGLVHTYRTEDAETVLVTLGSVSGAATEVVDELRAEGVAVGTLAITCFRPWPTEAIRSALAGAHRVVVLERAFSPGRGSIVGQDVRASIPDPSVSVVEVVGGLGGRPVTRASVRRLLDDVVAGRVGPGSLHFLDLDQSVLRRAGVG